MSDARVRELERIWRQTGTPGDLARYLRASVRAGVGDVAEDGGATPSLSPNEEVFFQAVRILFETLGDPLGSPERTKVGELDDWSASDVTVTWRDAGREIALVRSWGERYPGRRRRSSCRAEIRGLAGGTVLSVIGTPHRGDFLAEYHVRGPAHCVEIVGRAWEESVWRLFSLGARFEGSILPPKEWLEEARGILLHPAAPTERGWRLGARPGKGWFGVTAPSEENVRIESAISYVAPRLEVIGPLPQELEEETLALQRSSRVKIELPLGEVFEHLTGEPPPGEPEARRGEIARRYRRGPWVVQVRRIFESDSRRRVRYWFQLQSEDGRAPAVFLYWSEGYWRNRPAQLRAQLLGDRETIEEARARFSRWLRKRRWR